MGRLFAQPKPIRVEPDAAGAPARMHWRGNWERVRVANHWRIEDDWWRPGAEIARDYYRVWTASRLVAVIFRDDRAGDWYIEKILD